MSALAYRSISPGVTPCTPSFRTSERDLQTASFQRCGSAVMSREQTAHPSRAESSWLNSTNVKAGSSERLPTLSRIWSEASAMRRARERRNEERVVMF